MRVAVVGAVVLSLLVGCGGGAVLLGWQRARPGEQLDYSKNDEFSAGAWLPCTQASKRWNCFCLPPLCDNMMAYSKICMYI